MKLAFFGLEPWEKEVLRKAFPKDKLYFSTKKLTNKDLNTIKDVEVLTVFVNSKINQKVISSLPKLKYVATMSTGYDHLDLDVLDGRGIKASNVPFYGENTVAEHTFALILGLSRNLVYNVDQSRAGRFRFGGLRGFDLKGKTLGVVGGGSIGQHVAQIAKGFEMRVLVFDIHKNPKLAKKVGFRYATLDSLLRTSNIVSLHLPYNKHTHHLIDNSKIKLMPKGSYLINTSRGGIIDTVALLKGLKSGQLAGAGLDVLEDECLLGKATKRRDVKECDYAIYKQDQALMKLPNVLVTPHSAFNTKEAILRILNTTIKNIKSYKKGRIINKVSKKGQK
jgi:D-lactate dehydrogenase